MTGTSSNVVPLPSSAKLSQVGEINTALINFFQQLILPQVDTILSELIQYVVELSESGQNNSQIMHFMEKKQSLERYRKEISRRFEQESLTNFQHLEEEQSSHTSLTLNELALIDNGDLEKKLAWQHAANQLSMNDNLQRFNNIQSRLSELLNIEPERNPMGAQKICESFAFALIPTQLDTDLTQELLLQFALKIKPAVMELWAQADDHLDILGLKISKPNTKIDDIPDDKPFSESKHIESLPGSNHKDVLETSGVSPNFSAIETEGNNQGWDDALMDAIANKVVSRVEGLLHSTSTTSGTAINSDTKIFASVELASTLTSIQEELTGQHASLFSLSESIKSAFKDKGVKQKLSPRHTDLINMVGMLFEFILDDHELPDEVKKLIGLLQIPVLKLALLEEEFLTNRHHAARELLNDMTSAGMHTTLEPETEQPVIELIEETVKYIIKHFTQNPDIFSTCLETFNQSLLHIKEETALKRNTAEAETQESPVFYEEDIAEATEDSQTIENEFEDIVREIVSAYQYSVPEPLEQLIYQAWPSVLEHIESSFEADEIRWFDAINTLDLMLWNLQAENRDSIPAEDWLALKNMLLDYLNEIGHDPFVVVEWMHSLNTLISMPIEFPRETETITVSPEDIDEDEEQREPDMEEIVLQSQRQEQEQLINEIQTAEAIEDDDEESTLASSVPHIHTEVQLNVGQWVEFIGKQDQHFRCKLSSINTVSNRYIFVNSSGMKVAEMSGYELKSGIDHERIKVIEDTQFFDKALHAVMDKFLKF
ncbi:DUF1631 family protein [Endozoicomonas arenosclerae]|uniref:DUF1631 family protein n=1 Tax=Endozoicomonas arenosclerae TaxID=1633495 RepID=UPI0007842BCD|nr:DUF1631 family protein [Endozoicomonas arenosclerae]